MNIRNGIYGETNIIGKNISAILKARKLTYENAAKLFGYNSRQEVYYIIHNKLDCYWSEKDCDFIAKKLHITVEKLCKGLL